MSTPKAQTLQQRFGFQDYDLKSPKHDEMMLWLDQQLNSELERWAGLDPFEDYLKKAKDEIELQFQIWKNEIQLDVEEKIANDGLYQKEKKLEFLNEVKQFKIPSFPEFEKNLVSINKHWERPIADRSYTIGFVDLVATYNRPKIWHNKKYYWNEYLISFSIDNKLDGAYYHESFSYFFEVKTEIPSLGELLRQLNMYRQYIQGSKWFVVAPINCLIHAKILWEQGISTIIYPTGTVIKAE